MAFTTICVPQLAFYTILCNKSLQCDPFSVMAFATHKQNANETHDCLTGDLGFLQVLLTQPWWKSFLTPKK